MRRNSFEKNRQFLHVGNSSNLPKDTKIGRVLKYLDKFRKNFKAHCIWDRVLDVDKCIVNYFGQYGTFLKQSIRMRPIHFG